MSEPREKTLVELLASVDWIRTGHRVLAFARSIRGETSEVIAADNAQSVSGARKLHDSLEGAAAEVLRQAKGKSS